MKKQTRNQRSAEIGISIQTLSNWERAGVNVWDDADVRTKISRCRILPKTLKPEWKPVPSAPLPSDPVESSDHTERLISELAHCTDKNEAQRIKTQIDGLVNAYKLREAAGSYVSRSMVEEAMLRIGAAVKAAIMRMEADLPPMLEGMAPAGMQKVIKSKVDETMAMLNSEASKIWQPE
jgi:transcriptional regulator with XRE-family HTH domain